MIFGHYGKLAPRLLYSASMSAAAKITKAQSPYEMAPDIEVISVPTEDFENRIVRLIAQLLAIDEALALIETPETDGRAA